MKDNYDFTQGKRGSVLPTINKKRISIRFDPKIIDWFKHEIEEKGGGSYQTLMNKVLLEYVERNGEPLEKILRKVLREELKTIQPMNDLTPKNPNNSMKHAGHR